MSETLEELIAQVQLDKARVKDYRRGFQIGALSYDDLAQAGKDLSKSLHKYMSAKFPKVKSKQTPYQNLIR